MVNWGTAGGCSLWTAPTAESPDVSAAGSLRCLPRHWGGNTGGAFQKLKNAVPLLSVVAVWHFYLTQTLQTLSEEGTAVG